MELSQSEIDDAFQAILDDNIKIVKQAIQKGFTGLSKSSYSDMALHFACLNSKLSVMDLLIPTLKEGEINTINVEDDDPTICGTALHMSMDGQVDQAVVERLLKWGADPNVKDAKECPVLHELIYRAWEDIEVPFEAQVGDNDTEDEESDPQCLGELISKKGGDYENKITIDKDSEDTTPAVSEDIEMQKLIKPTESVQNKDSRTLDEESSRFGEKVLYEREPSQNPKSPDENIECGVPNPIFKFDIDRTLEKIHILHKYGLSMNLKHSLTQMTPVHYWFQRFNWAMVHFQNKPIPEFIWTFLEALLSHGASLDVVNARNDTPVVYLTQRHYKPGDTVYMESVREFTKKVLQKFTLFQEKDIHGRTLLHNAVEHCNVVMTKLLLEQYHDLNDKDMFGLTLLHLCTHTLTVDEAPFVVEMVNGLVKGGADVNSQDFYGATPLHHAVSFNNHAAIECLLKNGTKLDIRDNNGILATDIANINGNSESMKLLGHAIDKAEYAPVVSDIRFGWIFPLCCHKQYSSDSRGWEDPEQVEENEMYEWLAKYPVCEHNRKIVLQNAIASLEPRVQQSKLGEQDARAMRKDLYKFAIKITDAVKLLNPLFESHVIFGGSTSEMTKVGSCDEFDLVFDLFKLGELVDIVEVEESILGFVNLKVQSPEAFEKLDALGLIDENGYMKRTEASNMFHKYMQSVLNKAEIWAGHRFFAFWGQTNEQGECFNIGQLQMVWYGPYLKRQEVNVDIAPIIRKTNWLPRNWNLQCLIVDKKKARAIGCYLMMKDAKRYLENVDDSDDDMENADQSKFSNLLFKVSLSQLEHATMRSAPIQARAGYKLAKSIQLQCPHLLFNIFETVELSRFKYQPIESTQGPDGSLKAIFPVWDFVTSYVIKTGLFYELGNAGFQLPYCADDLEPRQWNHEVLSGNMFDQWRPSKDELKESVQWAQKIYKRVLAVVDERGMLPEYFLKDMEATKVPGKSKPFFRVMSRFLKCLIYFLEHFEIPDDVWYYT